MSKSLHSKPKAKPEIAPGLKAELARLSELTFYDKNPRTHSDAQVEQIIASMVKFGWTNPILADHDGIVAGHGRAEAARRLYAAATPIRLPSGEELPLGYVPVIDCTGWSPEDRRAYILADNQLALNAGWDMTLLRGEILALSEGGYEIGVLGFDEDFLSGLLVDQAVGLTDPDAAPPLPEVAITQVGDVWLLGSHRLVCGDSTDSATVAAALAGEKPGLMVTDPPYGVEYDPAWRSRAGISAEVGPAHGKVMNDHRDDWREAWALFPGNVAYVWHSGLHAATVAQSLEVCKFRLRAQIVWVKTRPVIGRGNYHWQHEPALYAVQEETDDGWRFVPEHEISAYAGPRGRHGRLSRQSQTVHRLVHRAPQIRHRPRDPEAGRVHAPADRE